MERFIYFFFSLIFPLLLSVSTSEEPLSANSRWIGGESGQRVKLTCLNWPSHLELLAAEGLSKRPVDEISAEIRDMGFNCVRLKMPSFLFNNDILASVSVRQSLKNLGLIESIAGVQTNNPSIVDLSLIKAYQAMVASLAKNSVMIILDNQLSKPAAGPDYTEARPHKILFHPMTGLCVKRRSWLEPLVLGPCPGAEAWDYTPQKTLTIKGTYFCLQAVALGKPAKLGVVCTTENSKWYVISDFKMHLSSNLEDGSTVCTDIDQDNNIVTNNCKCLNKGNPCDPGSQWFTIINSTSGRT